MKISRKEFLQLSVTFVGAGLLGCGSDSNAVADAAMGGNQCLTEGTTSSIGGNHGHSILVTTADISAATEKTYTITGSATHAHMVTLTASHFADLADDKSVTTITTSSDGHTHNITIACA